MTEKRIKFIVNAVYFAVIFAGIFFTLRYVLVWLLPFVIGFGLAVIFKPVAELIQSRLKIGRKAAGLLIPLLCYLAVSLLLGSIIWQLGFAVVRLFYCLPEIYANDILPAALRLQNAATDFLNRRLPFAANEANDIFNALGLAAEQLAADLSHRTVSAVAQISKRLPKFAVGFIFSVMSSIIITMDYGGICSFILRQLPERLALLLPKIKKSLGATVAKYLRAYITLMAITFLELSAGLWLLRIENPLAVALVIAAVDVLPVLGTGLVMVPWIITELIKGNFFLSAGLAVLYLIIVAVRNIIEPKIVGDSLGLNPLVTLISMYVGLTFFGVMGMIALPITVMAAINLHREGYIKLWK